MKENCRDCFFREISMKQGAFTTPNFPKLWCWLHDKHVHRASTCGGWTDSSTEGDPRQVAEQYRVDPALLAKLMSRARWEKT